MTYTVEDVSESLWEAVDTINAFDFTDLQETEIFKMFKGISTRGSFCMVRAEASLPPDLVKEHPEGAVFIASQASWLFDSVDSLFKGIARMFETYGSEGDPRKYDISKCIRKMQGKLDCDAMEEDFASLWSI